MSASKHLSCKYDHCRREIDWASEIMRGVARRLRGQCNPTPFERGVPFPLNTAKRYKTEKPKSTLKPFIYCPGMTISRKSFLCWEFLRIIVFLSAVLVLTNVRRIRPFRFAAGLCSYLVRLIHFPMFTGIN